MTTLTQILNLVAAAAFVTAATAQEVSIPDPGLNAAVRAALQKPAGPLTAQDMLGLTVLNAHDRNISNLAGLEAARNLNTLLLFSNHLTQFSLPTLTNLVSLNLSVNSITNVSLPGGMTKLFSLLIASNPLTQLTLPPDLPQLEELDLHGNHLTGFTPPAGLTNLHVLDLSFNQLVNLNLPADQRNLISLSLDHNQLTRLTLPASLTGLSFLHARSNLLADVTLPAALTNLIYLDLSANQLTTVPLPAGQSQLSILALSGNRFTSLALPPGLTSLTALFLGGNHLTNVVLPPDLGRLRSLDLSDNLLSSFTLPTGLTNLFGLYLGGNQFTTITLTPDLIGLGALGYVGNPLTTLVLPAFLAETTLAAELPSIRNRGVQVFPYPLTVQLVNALPLIGAFKFGLTGPPGVYTVLGSTNLTTWSAVGIASNTLGAVNFHDVTAQSAPRKFYRAQLQAPPANMVFIPASTFTMGSPTTEIGHQADEGPQTLVTLSHAFWIGKYEVTQREYLAVTGENPSGFPGDLDRPVESVSFFAASNYCVLLTGQDLAAGRIPSGTHYRLPTEAEWEYAARAGSTNRFSYGDDPELADLPAYAWFGALNGVTTHPVGSKLPNAWGLHDMTGNVWEWCQDWYGDYSGGSATDPQGPLTNPIGWKVIRGGAWESSEFDCRPASRWFEPASPFISDFIIGFRVVLVAD